MLRESVVRSPIALLLAAVLVAGGTVVPLLDAGPPDHRAQVESSHDPARCGVAHDHLACRVLSGGATAPRPLPGMGLRAGNETAAPARRTSDAPTTPSRTLPEPRGPPAAG